MFNLLFTFANEHPKSGQFLRLLSKEREGIEAALSLAEKMNLCKRKFIYDATKTKIISAFQEHNDTVSLFHYGGHAGSFDLLLQSENGEIEQVGGEGLVQFLGRQKGLHLVFLNGCHTKKLANKLLDAGVTTVIGTHVSISDHIATNLAIRFYRGLGSGLTIERAFLDAVDEIKMSPISQQGFRRISWEKENGTPNDVPWYLAHGEGKKNALQWSLAQNDPLLGLPNFPKDIGLPENPFVFFQRYKREHAKVFFGRSKYIRNLYDSIEQKKSPAIILLHGQSGAGKSSLLEAGLMPRLERDYSIIYLRRDKSLQNSLKLGLEKIWTQFQHSEPNSLIDKSTLKKWLDQFDEIISNQIIPSQSDIQQDFRFLSALKRFAESQEDEPLNYSLDNKIENLKNLWHSIEISYGKPLIFILDQVEETFIQKNNPSEWAEFLNILDNIFSYSENPVAGKLILGYRKEFHPEIISGLRQKSIPRKEIFLPTLNRSEIEEIVNGLANPNRHDLIQNYTLQVTPFLPSIIATDLYKDASGAIAPVLQILLTRMWEEIDVQAPIFTEKTYLDLKEKGLLLKDFFLHQTELLKVKFSTLVNNGLHIDFLYQLTTYASTSKQYQQEEIYTLYQGSEELISECKKLFLIRIERDFVTIIHDTLAPVIRIAYEQSNLPGQIARRILEGRVLENESSKPIPFDEYDLSQVNKGKRFMRELTEMEKDLLERSESLVAKKQKQRKVLFSFLGILVIATLFMGGYSYWQQGEKLSLELSLNEMENQRDRMETEIENSQNNLTKIRSQIIEQKDSINFLKDSTKQLQDLTNQALFQAKSAGNRFKANQMAADAISFLMEHKKHDAIKIGMDAFRLSSQSPAVLGAILKIAYDTSVTIQPFHPNYILEDHKLDNGYFITTDLTGFTINNSDSKNVFKIYKQDILQEAKFIKNYEDRVYFEMGMDTLVAIWEPIQSSGEVIIPGNMIGLESLNSYNEIYWTNSQAVWGTIPERFATRGSNASKNKKIRSISANENGKHVILTAPNNLYLKDTELKDYTFSFASQNNGLEYRKAQFSPKDNYIIAAQTQGNTRIYTWYSGKLEENKALVPKTETNSIILDGIMSNDERFVITIDNIGMLHLWDWKSEQLLNSHQFNKQPNILKISPDGNFLLIGYTDGSVYIIPWRGRVTNFEARFTNILKQKGGVSDISFSDGKSSLLAISSGQQVQLYDWQSLIPIWTFNPGKLVKHTVFSSDNKTLWVVTSEGLLSPILIDGNEIISHIIRRRYINP